MKRYTLIFCLALFAQTVFSQKIYFAKANYTDSTTIEKYIPALAVQIIQKYKDSSDKFTYYSTLAFLQIAARQYNLVYKTLNNFKSSFIPDTIQGASFQMPARVYCHAIGASSFNDSYNSYFTKIYSAFMPDVAVLAEYFYKVEISDKQKALAKIVDSFKQSDSLNLDDAVTLCKAFAEAKVYADIPLGIAKKLIAQFEGAKYISNDSVLIKMPNGGTIALTIIRKKEITTPQPVVLKYNIYAGNDEFSCKDAANKGYVGIVANTRGKRLSKDAIEPFEHDASDAYYIIDWISKQPWCNGKIGMYGGSYLGFAQWATVKKIHPALKTIVPQVSVGAGIDYPAQNGIFMSFMLRWLHYVMDTKLSDNDGFENTKNWNTVYEKWYKQGKSFRSLDSIEGRPNYIFQRWLQHPSYDSYWQSMTPQKQEFSKINIPILTISGYWDDDQLGAMYYYRQHHLWNKNANHYLIMGPWDHGGSQGYPRKKLSGYAIDSVANLPIQKIVFRWMDYVLKDSSRPEFLQDKVNFELMGKNEWRHVPSIDKMSNDTLTLYFNNLIDKNKYSLQKNKASKLDFIQQNIDFTDRSETVIKSGNIDAFPVILDTILKPEKEKLFFVSEPIEAPFAISGNIKATIFASINKKDMDIVLDLYEQTPDGKFLALNENLQRASYAKNRTKRQLLKPNKTEQIDIANTFITSRQLQKGSRIIVLLGINKNPSWQINYGTGKDVSDEIIDDAKEPLKIKWYNNSCIKIPVLK